MTELTRPKFGLALGGAFQLSSSCIGNLNPLSYQYNILIRPDIVGVKRWYIGKRQFIYQQGRKAAEAAIPQIKKT